jgi:hypothetical protein
MRKWIFAIGAGIGYIFGTKAGRQRYEQMRAKARETLDRPEVRHATQAAKAKVDELVDEGRRKMRDIRQRAETSEADPDEAMRAPLGPSS